jgi:Dehydrogenases with different specificities (related to short-chain alcohol dehydrogenases)
LINNIAILGGSGAIGSSFTKQLSVLYPNATINVFSRHKPDKALPDLRYHCINYQNETSINKSALIASKDALLDMVIVATGILHEGEMMPEKSLKDLNAEKFHRLFEVNTIAPILIAKHFLPKLNRETRSIFAALSARVGSISDNHLGGWYSYRASKAALNMVIKNLAIEISRSNKKAIIVGLHPGTVDSNLSKPFQRNVPQRKLFKSEYSTQKLLEVLANLTSKQSGKCFAWDGKEILP